MPRALLASVALCGAMNSGCRSNSSIAMPRPDAGPLVHSRPAIHGSVVGGSSAGSGTAIVRTAPWRALLISGGGDSFDNVVSHERNVLFAARTLGDLGVPRSAVTVLFGDGPDPAPDVRVDAEDPALRRRLYAIGLLRTDEEQARDAISLNRNNAIDGARAADRDTLAATLHADAREAASQPGRARDSLLLYVTDHGRQVRGGGGAEIVLWGERGITPRELVPMLDEQPPARRVVTVMSQCYSGAFATVVHEAGDPRRPVTERVRCGFFAAPPDRVSSGCTSQLDEANYDDYTTWFFAALGGRDRTGAAATGADTDGNGRVSFDEAHRFAIEHDAAVDVPVASSEEYLRRMLAPVLLRGDWLRRPARELLPGARPELQTLTRTLLAQLGVDDTKSRDWLRRRGSTLRRFCWPALCESIDALTAMRAQASRALRGSWAGPVPDADPLEVLNSVGAERIDRWIVGSGPYLDGIERLEQVVDSLSSTSDAVEARVERLGRVLDLVALEAAATRTGGAVASEYQRIRDCELGSI